MTEQELKKLQKEVVDNDNWIKGKKVRNHLGKNSNMGSKQRKQIGTK